MLISTDRTKGEPTKTLDYRDMFFFGVPRYRRPALKNNNNTFAQVIFLSRGADPGVNR